jgi:AmmeMemoRadiSam system protein A
MNNQTPATLTHEERETLLAVAQRSIRHGLDQGSPLPVNAEDYEAPLRALRASFVTLNLRRMLRGCIGHLEATQPLVVDVADNAFSAAFSDPRFPPLTDQEFPGLELHISVLSPAEPLACESESELLQQLRPYRDGLILAEGTHRGTFLPSVWEQLPEAKDFLLHLKRKTGLPDDYWSPNISVYRYESESFP